MENYVKHLLLKRRSLSAAGAGCSRVRLNFMKWARREPRLDVVAAARHASSGELDKDKKRRRANWTSVRNIND
jgi:hypothetical protein